MSEPVIPERQTAGHGYDAECECDLVGGDPDCKIQPPYETVEAYVSRLQAKIADLLGGDPVPASWPKGAGLHYCEHCQQASHDHEWVQLETKVAEQAAELDKWREREASVCPEDYGFEEVTNAQAATIERLTGVLQRITTCTGKKVLDPYAGWDLVYEYRRWADAALSKQEPPA